MPTVIKKNNASFQLLERLGFRKEASRLKNMYFKVDIDQKPLWFDSYQYAMLREEYFLKNNLEEEM